MAPPGDDLADVGCVVIGRNEAPRLRRCLDSILADCRCVVYVDSGSTDASVAIARTAGVPVLELDPARPFGAARARNEGLAHLLQTGGAPSFVQFVDGDCCLEPGWLRAAAVALRGDPGLAVVTGRSREATPSRSPYKLLCDIELDVPVEVTGACGGVAMMRADAVTVVGGYDATLSAGEEPELCLRLRRAGWRVGGLAAPMMQHELSMQNLGQWWRRSSRSGRAYLESWWKHRGGPERYRRREVARIVVWGGLVPALLVTTGIAFGGLWLLGACAYALPALRAYRWARRGPHGRAACLLYSAACVVGKLPEFAGAASAWWNLVLRRRAAAAHGTQVRASAIDEPRST